MSPTDPTQPKAGQTPEDRSRTVDGLPIVHVVLDLPLAGWFDYQVPAGLAVAAGDWVVVPWGRGRRVGLVIEEARSSELPAERLKAIIGLLPDMPRADAQWLGLLQFAARYYHCPLGEIALPSVPKLLRAPPAARSRGSAVLRARQRFEADRAKHAGGQAKPGHPPQPLQSAPFVGASHGERVLTDEQANTLSAFDQVQGHAVHLLHGITGSGKTEIYLRWIEQRLSHPLLVSNFSADAPIGSPIQSPVESPIESPVPSSTRPQQQAAPGSPTLPQALILVPEIALTPVLAQRIRERFPQWPLAVLHSDMPEAERAAHWLAAAEGRARIVLGTRLAVLAPPAACPEQCVRALRLQPASGRHARPRACRCAGPPAAIAESALVYA
ncbi:MAG: DEAD/DEAH box helicase, partial [Burkholderiales bacterium]